VNLKKHHNEVCWWCGTHLWYGVKQEPTGWKVFYECNGPNGCGREWCTGRIDRSGIHSTDEVFARAADMPPRK
jgi:hypothetical protein